MQYKTAFVLTRELREALAAEQAKTVIDGEVSVYGVRFGGSSPASMAARHELTLRSRRPKVCRSRRGLLTGRRLYQSGRELLQPDQTRRSQHPPQNRRPAPTAYAAEMSWREDNRRVSNAEHFLATTAAALDHPVSRKWAGYSQRAGV